MGSIIFFPSFLVFSSIYAFVGRKYGSYHKNLLILIFAAIYIFILGVRVNFGTDQSAYLHMYYYQGADLLRCEKLFVLLNQFLRSFNAPYQLLFGIIAFVEIYFLILAFEKENVDIFWGYVLFFLIYINLNLNLSRQAMAMGLILLSIVLFARKKYISWLVLSLIASGFHVSAILTLFLVPFLNLIKKIKFPQFVYYALIFLSAMFFERLFDIVLNVFLTPLSLAFGNTVTVIQKVVSMKIPIGSGMGIRLRGIAYICMFPLLFDYKRQSEKNAFYFLLFYFGIFGEFLASVNMNLARIFYYFSQVQLIVLPQIISTMNISNLRKLKLKEVLFLFGIFLILVLAVPKWISGADTTAFYHMSLDFDLLENHNF